MPSLSAQRTNKNRKPFSRLPACEMTSLSRSYLVLVVPAMADSTHSNGGTRFRRVFYRRQDLLLLGYVA
jgi:hypothetical protein